jgi:hypothetical protein
MAEGAILMQLSQLDLDQIFPIKDAESARLAMLKANYLEGANVIDATERQIIFARALAMLDVCYTRRAA